MSRPSQSIKQVAICVGFLLLASAATASAVDETLFGLLPPYRYVAEVRSGTILAVVEIDANDPEAMQRYVQSRHALIPQLIAGHQGSLVPVQVSFKEPLPPRDVDRLLAETEFDLEIYTMADRTTDGDLRFRWVVADQVPLAQSLPSDDTRTGSGEEDSQTNTSSVVAVKGKAPASELGLGRLAQDGRVYLADTTAVEIAEGIRWNPIYALNPSFIGKSVESVSLPAPYMSFVQ